MDRREILKLGGLAGGVALAARGAPAADSAAPRKSFQLQYAPHFGMFRRSAGEDPIDQLKFAADQGFTAWEDNGMRGKPAELQERIARTMQQLNMRMGVFVATGNFGKAHVQRPLLPAIKFIR